MCNIETEGGPKGQTGLSITHPVRVGWDELFNEIAKYGNDQWLDNVLLASPWDKEEWEWYSYEEQPSAKT